MVRELTLKTIDLRFEYRSFHIFLDGYIRNSKKDAIRSASFPQFGLM